MGLGALVLKDSSHMGRAIVTGAGLSILLAAALAVSGNLHPFTLRWLGGGLALFGCFHAIPLLLHSYVRLSGLWLESDRFAKFLWLCLLSLLFVRLNRCLLPSTNWDTLGYHLELLRAHLGSGDLSALYDLPTDRRVPLLGTWLKSWYYAWDEHGRGIALANWSFHIATLSTLYSLSTRLYPATLAPGILFAYAGLSEAGVHLHGAGDETFFCAATLMVLELIFSSKTTRREFWAGWLACGSLLGIKIITLLWTPWLMLGLLLKKNGSAAFAGIICVLILGGLSYGPGWYHYDMLYPVTRHANLLYSEPTENSPRVFRTEDIREQRDRLGIPRDVNDRGFAENNIARWFQNVQTFLLSPLGPGTWWFILLMPWILRSPSSPLLEKNTLWLSLFCLLSLNSCFALWPFSGPALTRYTLPLSTPWTIVSIGSVLALAARHGRLRHARLALGILMLFALALEGRELLKRWDLQAWTQPRAYLLNRATGGAFIRHLETFNPNEERIFYIGPSPYLLSSSHALAAGIGNEVGWRNPDDVPAWLRQKHIRLWALSDFSHFDPRYAALTSFLEEHGILRKLSDSQGGKIYRVQEHPDKKGL